MGARCEGARSPIHVAGVDACAGGWIVTTTGARRSRTSVRVAARFAEIVEVVDAGLLDAVGVDMPIGLADAGPRACDLEARARLGPRRSSVFAAPPRPLLASTTTHEQALAASRAIDGKGISKQTFHLLPKIAEVDAVMTPARQRLIFECHPESCFRSLAGRPLLTTKRTALGQDERASLLRSHFPDVDELLRFRPRGARIDDVLDALANAWAARRWRRGTASIMGDGARDRRGLRMQIVA
ncbi:MAG: DUF429 domain-containing protein [Actinobacteria bacterium]|nr:DUF429 domain-containing protein [Actinomycetota bacterium]